jgi:hypothetical protein
MDIKQIIESITLFCQRNFPPQAIEEIIVEHDGNYIKISVVATDKTQIFLGKMLLTFLNENSRASENTILWIIEAAKILEAADRWNIETVPTLGEGFKTIESYEAEEMELLSKPDENKFTILRITPDFNMVVVAGNGNLYIHQSWLKRDDENFFHVICDDTLDNRYLYSVANPHDNLGSREVPDGTFDHPRQIKRYIQFRRKKQE